MTPSSEERLQRERKLALLVGQLLMFFLAQQAERKFLDCVGRKNYSDRFLGVQAF